MDRLGCPEPIRPIPGPKETKERPSLLSAAAVIRVALILLAHARANPLDLPPGHPVSKVMLLAQLSFFGSRH